MSQSSLEDVFGPVIYSYTRAQALEDGVLRDVSEMARGMGFQTPVAVTAAVWAEVVTPDETPGQSVDGRLWDVLWMLLCAIRTTPKAKDELRYQLYAMIEGREKLVTLKALIGPGDDGAPVITIMYPEED